VSGNGGVVPGRHRVRPRGGRPPAPPRTTRHRQAAAELGHDPEQTFAAIVDHPRALGQPATSTPVSARAAGHDRGEIRLMDSSPRRRAQFAAHCEPAGDRACCGGPARRAGSRSHSSTRVAPSIELTGAAAHARPLIASGQQGRRTVVNRLPKPCTSTRRVRRDRPFSGPRRPPRIVTRLRHRWTQLATPQAAHAPGWPAIDRGPRPRSPATTRNTRRNGPGDRRGTD